MEKGNEKKNGVLVNRTKTNGITTYNEIHGDGPPLVLIHGVSLDHNMWQPQITYFSKRYKVLVYDVRGHGQTEGSDGDYSMELFANDLKALLDNLNIQKPIVCGLSMGGIIAQMFAVKYPAQLRALIIADSAAKFRGITLQEKLLYALYPKFISKLLFHNCKRQLVNLFFCFFKGMNPEAKDLFRNAMLEFKEDEFLKLLDCFYDFDLTTELAKITVPTLIIVGEREKMGFAQAEKMHELIEQSAIVNISDAYHLTNLENPEQFNRAVAEFLNVEYER